MSYEVAAGAIMLSICLYLFHAPWPKAVSRWLADVAAVGLTLAFVTSGTWNEPQPLATQLDTARDIARGSFTILASAAVPFASPGARTVTVVAFVILAAGVVVWARTRRGDPVREHLRRWLLTAAASVITIGAGYLMFIPANPADYSVLAPGQGNRINVLAALGYVMLVCSLLVVAATLVVRGLPRWRTLSWSLVLVFCLVIGIGYARTVVGDARDWDRAASLQQVILDRVEEGIPRPQAGSVIFTLGHPVSTAPQVPVFIARWDLDGAVKLMYDDPSVTGYPAVPGTRFVCEDGWIRAVNSNDRYGPPQVAPYGKAFLVDVASGRTTRIGSRSECMVAAAALAL
jgi:hypothetical protein